MTDAYTLNGSPWRNRIKGYDDVPPDSLLANEANFRIHPAAQQNVLAGALDEIGWISDIIVNLRTSPEWGDNDRGVATVLDGHLRVQLALRNGAESVPVKYVDLTPNEERLALATFDRSTQMAAVDPQILDGLLRGVSTTDEHLQAMLADMAEEAGLYFGENGDGEADAVTETEAEKHQREWQTSDGQIWQLGIHRLFIGDCRDADGIDRLLQAERPRYGFHDPPYGINVVDVRAADSGGPKPFGSQTGTIGFHNTVETNRYAPVYGDNEPFNPAHLLTASDDVILWGANYYADKLPPRKGWIVWDKKGRDDWRDNFSDCELAWSSLPIVTKIFRHTWMGMVQEGERESRVHPTQKPVALIEKIMSELFRENGIVVDYYAGSGPVLLAAERLGRPSRVAEIMPQYGATILQRFLDATGIRPELID